MFAMFTFLKVETEAVIDNLQVGCKFQNVFPNYINDFLPKRK